MTQTTTNPKVDAFLRKAKEWRDVMEELRRIVLGCDLTEELKWGKPCYSYQGSNVVIVIPLKECCALAFCQGALLKDAKGILCKPGENTQAGRWIKFTDARQVVKLERTLKAYLGEAISAEKAGLKVKFKATSEYAVPDELKKKLQTVPAFERAFAALTPGRQRGYLLHFSAPKQSKTRDSRIEKCVPRILAGRGLNDR